MKRALEGHEVRTVSEMKWSGITNGKLLALAASHFDAFITVDKNMSRQQNLATLPLPVIEIRSRSIRWADVSPHVDEVVAILSGSLETKLYTLD
jgi:hypothetical protein